MTPEEEWPRLDLAHFGVKGMHWGQHKAQPASAIPSVHQRASDVSRFGKHGAKRIQKHMAKGKTRQEALSKEAAHADRHARRLAAGAQFLGAFLANEAIGAGVVAAKKRNSKP
jgi:hypothetical protein